MSYKQDTGKFRKNTKDQFYTNIIIAKECIQHIYTYIPNIDEYVWIEPSAGNGSFFHHIPEIVSDKIGLDIDPKGEDILLQDYLSWDLPQSVLHRKIIIFGNPPFGRQSSIAKAFITKSCKFADVIAFILPKSFVKPSMNNVFNSKFHCIYSNELAKNSFLLNDIKYDVPCVFQIWQRQDIDRPITEKVNPVGFQYVTLNDEYNIAFRRVGGLAGKCYKKDGKNYNKQSHYFLKLNDEFIQYIDDIITKINIYEFPSNTVGPRSLSKTEINRVINSILRITYLPLSL